MVEDTFIFRSGYKVKISLTDNPSQIQYSFFDKEGIEINAQKSGLPTHMGDRSSFIKELRNCANPNGKINESELRKIKSKLQKMILALQGEAEAKEIQEKQEHDLKVRKKIHEAKKVLESLDNPILYIGSIIDWMTAGERINTLICFISGCSQVILKKPISVIGYGESSSGKTHIEKTALSLLPDDYIVIEKQVSPAALFNRSKTDEYFYDGKIVVYGDMGGDNDHDNQQEAFDLMKELQSDGKISKPVSVKDESNNWVTVDLVLYGNPCLWYTTVPVDIDTQELSRAIVFTPRIDNQDIFNSRGRALSFKKGRTYSLYEEIKSMAELVPYMVQHLHDELEDYIIINPYFDVIVEILGQSKFYKRDTEKYVALLDTITALNFYQNEHYVFDDGQKAIITSKDDVKLLLSLLDPYQVSIAFNIKPKSAEIYEELTSEVSEFGTFADELKYGDDKEEFTSGFTSREYFEKSKIDLSLRSVQRYLSDLYQAGLLTVKDRQNNTNLYDVVKKDFNEIHDEIDYDKIADRTEYELGFDVAEIIRNDIANKELDINNKHDSVGEPQW